MYLRTYTLGQAEPHATLNNTRREGRAFLIDRGECNGTKIAHTAHEGLHYNRTNYRGGASLNRNRPPFAARIIRVSSGFRPYPPLGLASRRHDP